MSEWITDRRPTEDDGKYVYSFYGNVCLWSEFRDGEPWKPIPKCEPYVWKPIPKCEPYVKSKRKPKRYKVKKAGISEWHVIDVQYNSVVINHLVTREAANEIAAVLERVKPWMKIGR